MIFDADRLRQLCPEASADIIEKIAPALDKHAPDAGITTLLRRSHLIAQLAHESAGFRRLVENLNYSPSRIAQVWPRLAKRADKLAHKPEALANAAYANKIGNGDEASGDGWRYRGRGLIQLTGRDNYRAASAQLGLSLPSNPDQAAEPDTAVQIALWFWRSRACNVAADLDDVEAVTRKINGGINGLADREHLTERAKRIFTTQPSEGLIA